MTQASLEVALDSEVVELGGAVSLHLRRYSTPEVEKGLRRLKVELICTYTCTQNSKGNDSMVVARGAVDVDPSGAADGVVTLPVPADATISYQGALIRNTWRIDVIEDYKRNFDEKVRTLEVYIVPTGGAGLYDGPHPLRPN